MYHPLSWNPWNCNPLDAIEGRTEKKFATLDGRPVRITMTMNEGFVVWIEDVRFPTGDNIPTCAFLNTREIGQQT